MRRGILSWNPLVKLALASGKVPTPLMEVFWGMGLARSVVAGVRLGLFETLRDAERTAPEIATAIAADPRATGTLLAALNGFGYLKRRRGRYRLAPAVRRWLLASSEGSVAELTAFVGDLFQSVEPVEEAIRTGRLVNLHDRGQTREQWGHYVRGLGTLGKFMGAEVVGKVPVDRPPKRLLDVAGGH